MPVHDNTKGAVTTAENPGNNPRMLWIRDIALVHQGNECLIWPFFREDNGYGSFGRRGKKIWAHRYICELAHGAAPAGRQAGHSCDNGHGGCVNPRHLSWKTPSENQLDRFRAGPRAGRTKLSPQQHDEIFALRGKEPVKATAARFGISVSHAKNIQTGYFKPSGLKRLSDVEVNEIRRLVGTTADAKLARQFGVGSSVIMRIRRGISFTYIPHLPAERVNIHHQSEGQ